MSNRMEGICCTPIGLQVQLLVDRRGIADTNRVNLQAALAAALLQLPSAFDERELYREICQLSYYGDVRMLFAEDRKKV